MRILNFGSLNVDHVYRVPHFVVPGETLDSDGYRLFPGGKGSNQSMALALAGAQVCHAGKLGADGNWLKERLARSGVDTTYVEIVEGASGHAIIQVTPEGQNAIILHGGANRRVDRRDAERIVANFAKGDVILLQNEISSIGDIMQAACTRGMKIFFNPAPMAPAVWKYPLHYVDWFCLNEGEAAEMTGVTDPEMMVTAMQKRFPQAKVVLTLGANGVLYADGQNRVRVPAVRVRAVDTTAAGDTFIGYFLADTVAGKRPEEALRTGCRAAALCVMKPGAADSIPTRQDVERFQPASSDVAPK